MHYRIYDLDPPKVEDSLHSGGGGSNEATADDGSHMTAELDTSL